MGITYNQLPLSDVICYQFCSPLLRSNNLFFVNNFSYHGRASSSLVLSPRRCHPGRWLLVTSPFFQPQLSIGYTIFDLILQSFPHIIRSILISAVSNRLMSSARVAQVSAPQQIALLAQILWAIHPWREPLSTPNTGHLLEFVRSSCQSKVHQIMHSSIRSQFIPAK